MDEWQISLGYVRGSNIYVRGYLDLRAWSLKTTCVDMKKPLQEGAFFLRENDAFPFAG